MSSMRVRANKQTNLSEFRVHCGDIGIVSRRIRRRHQFLRDVYLAVFEQNLSPVIDEKDAVKQSSSSFSSSPIQRLSRIFSRAHKAGPNPAPGIVQALICASELSQPSIVASGKQIISAPLSFASAIAFSIRTKLPLLSPSRMNIWHIASSAGRPLRPGHNVDDCAYDDNRHEQPAPNGWPPMPLGSRPRLWLS